jgi:flagellar motor switch protein FliN
MDDELTPDDVENLSQAMEGKEYVKSLSSAGNKISSAQFMQLEEAAAIAELPSNKLESMHDVRVHVEVILGKTQLSLEKILELHEGSVVELNKLAGEPVELYANKQLMARGEIVVVDENFGVKVIEIAGMEQRMNIN